MPINEMITRSGKTINQAEIDLSLQGLNGTTGIADTDLHTGSWLAIQVKTDTVFSKLTNPLHEGAEQTGKTWSAGSMLTGEFTEIQLSSGEVLAFKGVL